MDYFVPCCLLIIGGNLLKFKFNGNVNRIFTLIFYLFLFQLLYSVIKYIKYGSIEPVVGSIQSLSGSASTILVLIIVSFCIAFYLVTKENKYLFALIIPIFIGVTTEKRVIWFYIPILFFFMVLFFNYINNTIIKGLKPIIMSLFVGTIVIYLGLRLSPTLNPEGQVWGEFNAGYALSYAEEYNLHESEEGIPMQRVSGAIATITEMSNWNVANILFGKGPTYIYNYVEENRGTKWGFWGRETALSMFLITYGVLGLLALYIFIFSNLKFAIKAYKKGNSFEKSIAIMVFGFFIIYILDFLYSRSAVENHILSPVMMFFIGYCIQISCKKANNQ